MYIHAYASTIIKMSIFVHPPFHYSADYSDKNSSWTNGDEYIQIEKKLSTKKADIMMREIYSQMAVI